MKNLSLRMSLWAQHNAAALPALREQVARERDGWHILPGSMGKPAFAGNPPDWKAFPPSADPEWIWALNRHLHWPRFLCLAALDRDDTLVAQVLAEWLHWIDACPLPAHRDDPESLHEAFDRPTPWRTLEAGLRMERSWTLCREALDDHPLFTAAIRERVLDAARVHGRVLATVPAIFWPNADHNHYLSEMAGLLALALTFHELPESPGWRDQAWRELGHCLVAQFSSSGGHIEGCPHYHGVSLRTFAIALMKGRAAGLPVPANWGGRIDTAIAYALHCHRPNGEVVPWGDSDAVDHGLLAAAILAANARDDTALLPAFRSLVSPAAWNAAVADSLLYVPDPVAWRMRLDTLPAAAAPPRRHHQEELRQIALRTDWTPRASSVFAACRCPVYNGHAHIDPAGFDFCAHGRAMAVDPGRYCYREGPDRRDFKSAAWHNTATLDDREPFAYVDSWTFTPQESGFVHPPASGPGWQAAFCEQHNFAPVIHRRALILHDASAALVVVDQFDHLDPAQTLQLWFHIDSRAVEIDPAAPAAETRDPGCANLRIVGPRGFSLSTHPGCVSTRGDEAHPSTRLRFSDAGGPCRRVCVTLLLPRAAGAPDWPAPALRIESTSEDGLRLWLDGEPVNLP